MSTISGNDARAWIDAFERQFIEQAELLGDLDRQAGDGDFAENITSALSKARRLLNDEDPSTYRAAFTALARGFLDTGGTSGPLFGMFFREVAKAPSIGDEVEASSLAGAVGKGLELIQQRGGAQVGDCTMVDALAPASCSLTDAAARGSAIASCVAAAADAATAGAASTEALLARRGRASYVGQRSRGVIDPGAVTVALFFAAGVQALGGAARAMHH